MKKVVMRFDCVNQVKVEKSKLLRIVLTPNNTVEVDPSGKVNGRGVYLTPDQKTFEKALKTKILDKSLGVKIPSEIYDKIKRYLVDDTSR